MEFIYLNNSWVLIHNLKNNGSDQKLLQSREFLFIFPVVSLLLENNKYCRKIHLVHPEKIKSKTTGF